MKHLIQNLIDQCDLDNQYQIGEPYVTSFVEFASRIINNTSFVYYAKNFIKRFAKIPILDQNSELKISLDNFLRGLCQGNLYVFWICHQHQISDFAIIRKMTKFCKRDIDELLTFSVQLRMTDIIDKNIKNVVIGDICQKIIDTYVLLKLAKLFAILQDFVVSRNPADEIHLPIYINYFSKEMQQCLVDENYINKLFDPENPSMEHTLLLSYRNFYFSEFKTQISGTDQFKIYRNRYNDTYSKLKIIHDFFCNNNMEVIIDLCKKYPEIDADIGHYLGTQQIKFTRKFVAERIAVTVKLYIYQLLSDTNQKEPNEFIEQIDGLEMPVTMDYTVDAIEI